MNTASIKFLACPLALVLALALAGCPPQVPETRALTLLTAGDALKADVPLGDIDAFWVTVTEVVLDRAEAGEGVEDVKQANGDDNRVVVFSGALETNLRELFGISELITSADVPAGRYTKVRLSIENPRLYLAAAPDAEITDIQLTAGGRLFVSQSFDLPEGQTSLIQLELDGIKLVALGHGGYTLTPQLAVNLDITDAGVSLTGEVASVDDAAGTMVVALPEGSTTVAWSQADIWLPGDTDTPSGTGGSLSAGVTVSLEGVLALDGTVTATAIRILS